MMFLMSEISSEPAESTENLGILFFPYFGFSAAQLCARTHVAVQVAERAAALFFCSPYLLWKNPKMHIILYFLAIFRSEIL